MTTVVSSRPHPSLAGPCAPNVLALAVELTSSMGANARRRWVRRMRRALHARGLTLAHKWGICLLIGLHGDLQASDRHAAVAWLIDQPEVTTIVVHPLLRVIDLMGPKVHFSLDDTALVEQNQRPFRDLMRRLFIGALIHRDHGPMRRQARV